MNWFPLHCHSHYSLLDGLSKPEDIANRCLELGLTGSALTDHGSLGGSHKFIKAMTKKGLKPIIGCEFYFTAAGATNKTPDNRKLSHLLVLAKNYEGWKKLVTLSSMSNYEENYYYKPRVDYGMLAQVCDGNLIGISGHMGTELANAAFENPADAYNAKYASEVRIHPDAVKRVEFLARKHELIFGKGNFFLEVQLLDNMRLPAQNMLAAIMLEVSIKTGIPRVATADSHYSRPEDAEDQRILLCNSMNTTLKKVQANIDSESDVLSFFKSGKYYIPSAEEMGKLHNSPELATTVEIADMCEVYDLSAKPKFPDFDCPEGMSNQAYLRQLCRLGMNELGFSGKHEYEERLEKELQVFESAHLPGYFLIVQDYQNWAREQGWLLGPGRGSGAGCLVSYTLNITGLDPLAYNLLFERFYNAGRNTADRVSLPDIDCDFPVTKRMEVIKYLKDKYGHKRVAQICTYGRMQGREGLKSVLRAYGDILFEDMNRITRPIPDEAEISDQLQEMKEAGEDPSIIRWAIEHRGNDLKEWVVLNKDGTMSGPLADRFAQAIRLEGTYRTRSKHAAGVIISADDLDEICPMVNNRDDKELIAGMEMNDLEDMGHIKFDILGVAVLDKIMTAADLSQGIDSDDI